MSSSDSDSSSNSAAKQKKRASSSESVNSDADKLTQKLISNSGDSSEDEKPKNKSPRADNKRKGRSKEIVDSDDSSADDRKASKKRVSSQKSSPAKKKRKESSDDDADGNLISLGARKFATVSEFRGKLFVNLREYYEKDGNMLPGKKGIALNMENWRNLLGKLDTIEKRIQKLA